MTIEQRNQLILGCICAATGLITGIVVYMYPQNLNAPAWVAYVACLCFVLLGLSLVCAAYRLVRLQNWLGFLGALTLISPGAWIAFGSGERVCSLSLPFFSALSSEYACRAVFGLGTTIGILFVCAWGWRAFKTQPRLP